ncbi:Shedu anti-phage system protein SduA domain-containing protein [Fimbriiglobus ruber]|uniref:Shedu anti-phage system protein SduA domain-containing protein n=1 Tax=Fimbriiglobus ruber TaxID=1908690 RepID=UPI000B4BD734|nr:Shedu anti-phage system protein SduA domain-containing protein [Fimbriiglobus ruber]
MDFKSISPTKREAILARMPLREYFVWWMGVRKKDVNALKRCLATASREEDLQQFLTVNANLLIRHLGGGHGRWVIPKKKFGSEFITDFVIGDRNSDGFRWQAVELESPKSRMFTKAGNPSANLTHAIKQIQDWRAWLVKNQNYAARSVAENGLGLTDITARIEGLVLMGRRSFNDDSTKEIRRQMSDDLNIRFHSFDFLVDNAEGQLSV